jgi:single-strand selective monofunctional uracil DNA glycosylase
MRPKARQISLAPMANRDSLRVLWRESAELFDPLGREVAAATGWLVVNPGLYGERWHARFRSCYPLGARPLMFCGLNPGPYGMAQTGVPFTDLKRLASDLPKLARALAASGESLALPGLAPPSLRPFLTRTFESSAVRVYKFLARAHGTAEEALRRIVFVNPCPLLLIEVERTADGTRGANRTPADLGKALRDKGSLRDGGSLRERLDEARVAVARRALELLAPRGAVLLGRDVAKVLGATLTERLGVGATVEWEHPARAVPETWSRGLERELKRRGLLARAAAAGR